MCNLAFLRRISLRDWLEILGFALAIFAIWYSYYLSEPANLEVRHEVNETTDRLTIWVTNTAMYRETGKINLYRLEANPDKPHLQLNESLKPGQSKKLGLEFRANEINVTLPKAHQCTIPAYNTYFAVDKDLSISYKIDCDNCRTSVIRRIPEYDVVTGNIRLERINGTLYCRVYVIDYNWVEKSIAEIIENETAS